MKQKSRRNWLIGGTSCAIVLTGAIFGYREIYLQGIEELPKRPCGGAVQRATAAKILPAAHEVKYESQESPADNFFFLCSLDTGDSAISAIVKKHDASVTSWRNYWRKDLGDGYVEPPGNLHLLSWPNKTTIYLPCTPPGKKSNEAETAFSLDIEATVAGDSRISGDELRQQLSDFAVQVARHSQRAAQCREQAELPSAAPRVSAH
ncbi:hypothetical protein ABT381_12085 [Streptomyces sp. NPDC000151]|uniref:hypothetical protein n=1 Tax=Streptomyces sp. NPDC000151 TaxID=3154244 RepID=UPI00331BB5B5